MLASEAVLLFRQFVNEDLGCASYLVGDVQAGVAVVVDPAFAIEQYLAVAEQEGVRIERVKMRRRRRNAIKRRRPTMPLRRKAGKLTYATPVHRGEREIIARN